MSFVFVRMIEYNKYDDKNKIFAKNIYKAYRT